jgi:hemerythrin-like domain-containing protein
MNAIDLLADDHNKLKKILEEISKTTQKSKKTRENLIANAKEELFLHESIEEKLVYPLLKENEETRALALEAHEEHHFSNVILKEVEKTDIEDEKWLAKFCVFKENIYHHIKEEEDQIFKVLKKLVSNKELEELATKITELKKQHNSK